MIRCLKCVIPQTRPDTEFVGGICSACLTAAKRPQIDWTARKAALHLGLITAGAENRSDFDCIVPSSGGKDSHWQVLKLLELGARVLVVTATTCHLTPIGRRNIDNLARYAPTIEVTQQRTTRAKLNRLGLELVGDISWPEHVSIFTTPFRIATALGIPLIFYGENPQNQYGGPSGTEEAVELTRRWRSEFGGFLGLRPADMVGKLGITKDDMAPYEMPAQDTAFQPKAYFLGQFFEWDSHRNAREAIAAGMEAKLPCTANWWAAENQDNAQTGLHDHACYRKYGYGRLAAQISVDIRNGLITREEAMPIVLERDGLFPIEYAGVKAIEVAHRIGYSFPELIERLDAFTNWDLFDGQKEYRPLLKA